MGAFAAGTVVIIPFPFSDLSQSIANRVGELHAHSFRGIVDAVIALLQGGPP